MLLRDYYYTVAGNVCVWSMIVPVTMVDPVSAMVITAATSISNH
jgi:hypothetical protein